MRIRIRKEWGGGMIALFAYYGYQRGERVSNSRGGKYAQPGCIPLTTKSCANFTFSEGKLDGLHS